MGAMFRAPSGSGPSPVSPRRNRKHFGLPALFGVSLLLFLPLFVTRKLLVVQFILPISPSTPSLR